MKEDHRTKYQQNDDHHINMDLKGSEAPNITDSYLTDIHKGVK